MRSDYDIIVIGGGHAGVEAAWAAARLGARVRMISAVGRDAFADCLLENLRHQNIDTRHVTTVDGETGTAVIVVEPSGQNRIMVDRGANGHIALPEDDHLLDGVDALMMQFEAPMEVNIEAARRARRAGVTVVLDAGPAQAEIPHELVEVVDIVSPNETELHAMTGLEVTDRDSAEAAARTLLEAGWSAVVVKLGDAGALWMDHQRTAHQRAYKVDVVDTTAAGDAFTAALAVARADGQSVEDALAYACAAGALACTAAGAQPGMPTREAVQQLVVR
ncbi:MAG: PfkB family carbohydrate kinase [Planctomycetota bacterium]